MIVLLNWYLGLPNWAMFFIALVIILPITIILAKIFKGEEPTPRAHNPAEQSLIDSVFFAIGLKQAGDAGKKWGEEQYKNKKTLSPVILGPIGLVLTVCFVLFQGVGKYTSQDEKTVTEEHSCTRETALGLFYLGIGEKIQTGDICYGKTVEATPTPTQIPTQIPTPIQTLTIPESVAEVQQPTPVAETDKYPTLTIKNNGRVDVGIWTDVEEGVINKLVLVETKECDALGFFLQPQDYPTFVVPQDAQAVYLVVDYKFEDWSDGGTVLVVEGDQIVFKACVEGQVFKLYTWP